MSGEPGDGAGGGGTGAGSAMRTPLGGTTLGAGAAGDAGSLLSRAAPVRVAVAGALLFVLFFIGRDLLSRFGPSAPADCSPRGAQFLGDVPPRATASDGANVRDRHAVSSGEEGMRRAAPPDGSDVVGRELRAAGPLAVSATSLRLSVSNVLGLRAQREVPRVTAQGVVASVEYHEAFGNGAVMQHVGDPMRGRIAVTTQTDFAVPPAAQRTSPQPALVVRLDVYESEEGIA